MIIATLIAVSLIGIPNQSHKSAQTTGNPTPVRGTHSFELRSYAFLLDGKPFQIRSGELHPARIPEAYWKQRILMAKAMGLNTIAMYVFWNYQEPREGKFDFKSGNHDITKFVRICQQEGMWVLLRPGPYCCAEWDFGGIPPYLLKYPDLKVRCMDPRYIHAAGRYLAKLAEVIRPLQVSHGGPILMLQLENEYGSYGNDRTYVKWLHDFWRSHGIDIPFYTADGPTTYMLEAGSYPGCAIGLDSGGSLDDWKLARSMNPGVPIFSSETYPGWLTHWGEKWAHVSTASIVGQVKFLMLNDKSFNLYVAQGGTNFGFTAGANGGGRSFQPVVTSYDYDAPITEQGRATPKFMALRRLIGSFLPSGSVLPPIPAPIPTISIPSVTMHHWASIWHSLPKPIRLVQPKPFEELGQTHGLILYRTRLVGHKGGRLDVDHLHDFATVFLDGKFVGTLDRSAGRMSIDLPHSTTKRPTLDILVEAMGHINFGQWLIDRKGITHRVTLDGMTLMQWKAYQLPLDSTWISSLQSTVDDARPGEFFKGLFNLSKLGDTYIDVSQYQKGYVWVNGHNLGRYWKVGPQTRLYCPAVWLKHGSNDIVIFDLLQSKAQSVRGRPTLETRGPAKD